MNYLLTNDVSDRASLYELISRLFAAPDEVLIREIAATAEPEPAPDELRIVPDRTEVPEYDAAWRELQRLTNALNASEILREHEQVVGAGGAAPELIAALGDAAGDRDRDISMLLQTT